MLSWRRRSNQFTLKSTIFVHSMKAYVCVVSFACYLPFLHSCSLEKVIATLENIVQEQRTELAVSKRNADKPVESPRAQNESSGTLTLTLTHAFC